MTKTTTVAQLETQAEEISAELRELTNQRALALREGEEASRELEALNEPRIALSPKAFKGDAQAAGELEDLEDKAEKISRRLRLTRNAAEEFTREIEEVKPRLRKAEEAVHRQRYSELYDQSAKLDTKRAELAAQLNSVLDEQVALDTEMQQEARQFDQDIANRQAIDLHRWPRRWVKEQFGRWL